MTLLQNIRNARHAQHWDTSGNGSIFIGMGVTPELLEDSDIDMNENIDGGYDAWKAIPVARDWRDGLEKFTAVYKRVSFEDEIERTIVWEDEPDPW